MRMVSKLVSPLRFRDLRRRWCLLAAATSILVLSAMSVPLSAGALGPFPEHFGPEVYGVYEFGNTFTNEDSSAALQGGSHPFAMEANVTFNHTVTAAFENSVETFKGFIEETGERVSLDNPRTEDSIYGNPHDIEVRLPPGVVVNPNAAPVKCTEEELEQQTSGCPTGSVVGIATLKLGGLGEVPTAIYAMVPPHGAPAAFAINPAGLGFVVHLVGRLRNGGEYVLAGESAATTVAVSVYGFRLVFWGQPTAESHDAYRGGCAASVKIEKEVDREYAENGYGFFVPERFDCPLPSSERTGKPLLTLPGSCRGQPLAATLSADTWQEPHHEVAPPAANTTATAPAVTGCEKLHFNPSMDISPPEGVAAESPTGLNVDLRFPLTETEGLAEANLKKAVVTLPPGFAVSPSAANGLGACTPEQIGLHNAEKPSCPDSSKLGEAEVTTPLLEHPLTGAVYLAQQETFEGSLIALYIVIEGQGAVVKLGGTVALDPNTGQITATFDNNPQLPFGELKLRFFEGQRAPLVTPSTCGTYAVSSQLTPWSSNTAFQPGQHSFSIEHGCGHGFSPSFTAGTTNIQAGAYTPFTLTLSRQSGEQRFGSIRVTMPPGLLANLKSVTQCPEPQASNGECGEGSLIGESTASAGPGEAPYWVKGGKVYLTGPYGGAPFGLAIVVPAVAGPFNLGNVIARAGIGVDRNTAQAIVTSQIPTIKDGIPLDVRTINVTINRAGFTFNPTDCTPSSVSAIVTSQTSNLAGVSSPFDVANCAALPFRPSFAASTPAKTSKANGAGLGVKVGAAVGQANIAKVRVTLPKQLPARLTTLQKACTEAVFNADPAQCPPASIVGTAKAVTPVLAHPLTGPAYLVSHGGAAFPDLVFVLQGEGIKLYLDGNTNIKKGITTSTFNSVPDAPISTFETVFPQGPHSVLATNIPAKAKGSMCQQKLTMPTAITGQNSAVVTQTTKIAVTGCPKKAKPKKAHGKTGKR